MTSCSRSVLLDTRNGHARDPPELAALSGKCPWLKEKRKSDSGSIVRHVLYRKFSLKEIYSCYIADDLHEIFTELHTDNPSQSPDALAIPSGIGSVYKETGSKRLRRRIFQA